jgi:hypothetical protein
MTYRNNEDALRARIAELEKAAVKQPSDIWPFAFGACVGLLSAGAIVLVSYIYRHDADWLAIPPAIAGCAAFVITTVRAATKPPGDDRHG